jgi:hypothetical protein
MTPNNISRIESEDYGKQTITSLKRIAEAFDVALVVRFVPFGQYIDWLSGTPFLDEGIRPEALAVPSFEDEESRGNSDGQFVYWRVSVTPGASVTTNQAPVLAGNGFYQANVIPAIPIVHGDRKDAA